MEPNEAMKAMARRIAAAHLPASEGVILAGSMDGTIGVKIALSAIMETQEACAKLADTVAIKRGHANADVLDLATAIRTGEHYATHLLTPESDNG